MAPRHYRLLTMAKNGKVNQREFDTADPIGQEFEQVGVEGDSCNLRLHGLPIYKGLIGPMSDGKHAVRYEVPEVFVVLTQEWAKNHRGKLEED